MYASTAKFKMDKTYKKMDNITTTLLPSEVNYRHLCHLFKQTYQTELIEFNGFTAPGIKRKRPRCGLNKMNNTAFYHCKNLLVAPEPLTLLL
jgi:hypothetical protein